MNDPRLPDETALIREAIDHELMLLDPVVRADEAFLMATISPTFSEVGQTGRRWDRSQIVAALIADPGGATRVSDITGRIIGAGLVLVEYMTDEPDYPVRRSSLWTWSADGWQIVFHQGTRVLLGH